LQQLFLADARAPYINRACGNLLSQSPLRRYTHETLKHQSLNHGYWTVIGSSWPRIVVRLRKQALKRRKVKQFEQLQQTLMLNPHNPSRIEENAQKLKQNEFLPVMRAFPI
jgi:hypothetical protein